MVPGPDPADRGAAGRPPGGGLPRTAVLLAAGVALLAVVARAAGGASVAAPVDDRSLRVVEAPAPPARPAPTVAPVASPLPPVTAASAAWRTLPPAPLRPRGAHVAVWAGHRFVVWGGAAADAPQGGSVLLGDGALLADGTWTALPSAPLTPRRGAAAVWTGREVVVWGGRDASGHRADGAALDLAAGTWRSLPLAPIAGRSGATAVWTGGDVVVVGGTDAGGPRRDAAAYDPSRDRWRALPSLPETVGVAEAAPGAGGVVVWTQGIAEGALPTPLRLGGGAEAPRWSPLPALPSDVATLAGLVQGGDTLYAVAGTAAPTATRLLALPPTAAAWEPGAAVTGRPPSAPRLHWTGSRVLAVPSAGRAAALLYQPSRDRWSMVRPSSSAEEAGGWSQTWTGTELLVWGGAGGRGRPEGLALAVPRPSRPSDRRRRRPSGHVLPHMQPLIRGEVAVTQRGGPDVRRSRPGPAQAAALPDSSNQTTLPVGPTSAPHASASDSTRSMPRPVTASAP